MPLRTLALACAFAAAIACSLPARAQPAGPADVEFPGGSEGVTLHGTVLRPAGEGPFPAAVLVTGSGIQNRDSELLGLAPFRTLAEALAEAGVATLRYDDRGAAMAGVGASTGDPREAGLGDFAADAAAALDHLAALDGIDPDRLAVIGHSEGGIVAAMLASGEVNPANARVAAAVALAGPAVTGGRLMTKQQTDLFRAAGFDDETVARAEAAHRAVMEAIERDAPGEDLEEVARKLVAIQIEANTGAPADGAIVERVLPQAMAQLTGPLMREFVVTDPAAMLARSQVPVLAIYGGLDLEVPDETNAPRAAEALTTAGRDGSRVVVLPTKNHLFQEAQTGRLEEYSGLGQTPDDETLGILARWLAARLGM